MRLATTAFYLVIVLVIAPYAAMAQTAPDVVFAVTYTNNSSTATGSQSPATSWTDTQSFSYSAGTITGTSTTSGSVSGNSMTATNSVVMSASGSSGRNVTATQEFAVYVKGNPSVDATVSYVAGTAVNSGSGANNINSAVNSPLHWGFAATQSSTSTPGSDSDSGSESQTRHQDISCGSGGTTFAAYPGVTYAPLTVVGVPKFSTMSSVQTGGTGSTMTAAGTVSISLSFGASSPLGNIVGPKVGGVAKSFPNLGDSITFTNDFTDPDNQSGSGICSYVWTVSKPDGSTTGGTTSSITFTATIPGEYTAVLVVTDNEGATATDSKTFVVEERPIATGNSDGPKFCAKSPQSNHPTACAQVSMSGNIHSNLKDPVSTRSYPLVNNIHFNSQSHFTTRTTKMGNADFSYGIAVVAGHTYNRYGLSQTRWFLIDADGTETDYGAFSTSPVTQPGSIATLAITGTGFQLTNAGAPESIEKGGNWTYDFDSNGKLLSLTDPSNNVQEVSYDSNGDPTQVEDLSSARVIEFQYDTPGYIARVVEGAGAAVTHLTYSSGRLTNVTVKDSLANIIQETDIGYNGLGQINSIMLDNDANSELSFTYQHAGSGIYVGNMSFQGGNSNLDYFTAPASGAKFRTKRTTPNGGVYLYDFDANMDLVKLTAPPHYPSTTAPYTTYSWNGSRQLQAYNYNNGVVTVNLTYDSLGNITNVVNSWSGTWTYTYNGFDLLTVTDGIGTEWTYAYTDTNNPHSPTTITDGGSRTWTRTYNQYGQVLTVVPPTGSPSGTTTYAYEETPSDPAFGYLRKITNGAGDEETFDSYSPLGDLLERTTSPSSGVTNTTTYTYDASRRLTSIENPDATTFTWSYLGRLLDSTTDEAGTLNEFTWTPATEQLASVSSPLSHVLNWTYNDSRQVSDFSDARTNSTTYTYGAADELKFATYPDSSQIEYKYDAYGRLSSVTEPRGRITTYSYDNRNRITQHAFTNPSQTALSFAYRADDTLSSTTCFTGTSTYSYTSARQISSVDNNFGNSGLSNHQFLNYTYNPDGSVATMVWKSGTTTLVTWTYTYDAAGRMTGVSNSFGESTTYTYDGEGKIVTQTNGNGTTTSYTYNQARGWPTRIDHKLSGTSFARYDLEYDNTANTVGNVTKVTELDGTTIDYGYDALYRLTSETRAGTSSFSHTYGYDLAGNVTDLDGSTFATYDSANKFSSLSGGTYSYDGAGNLTAANLTGMGNGTFSYETRQKLDEQATSTTSLRYNYDVFGKRLLVKPSTTSSTYTWYVFDGDRLIGEIGTGGAKVAYTWGADGIVSERIFSGNKSRYYHFGPQGETRQLTNASGTVTNTYLYTAYGTTVASTGSDYNPHKYGGKVGYYSDGSLGLMLATQRWYSPYLFRWMTRDPIDYDGGENLYNYAYSNPNRYVDGSGLEPKSTVGGDDRGFNDDEEKQKIIRELEEKLQDKHLPQKERSQIKKRLRELRRRPSKTAQHHCESVEEGRGSWNIPKPPKWLPLILLVPFPGNPIYGGL